MAEGRARRADSRSGPQEDASPNAANRLVGVVEEVAPTVEGARVRLRLVNGQGLALTTSRTAVDWLHLEPGRTASVSIEDSAVHLTSENADSR